MESGAGSLAGRNLRFAVSQFSEREDVAQMLVSGSEHLFSCHFRCDG
jgi:hypothetical protein